MAASALLLRGKVCAITGGTTGIGAAIALEYLRQGALVAVNYLPSSSSTSDLSAQSDADRSLADLVTQVKQQAGNMEANFLAVPGDVRSPETGPAFVDAIVQKWGRLDVFVSNAGVCRFENFLDVSLELLQGTVATNLVGAFWGVQAAAKQMVRQKSPLSTAGIAIQFTCKLMSKVLTVQAGGSIIAISSISALVGGGRQTHYTPTKAGVSSLMQSCAVALGQHGIRCNSLLPGTIRTQMNESDLGDAEKESYMSARIPLGRLGRPQDMAGPAVFLACEELSGYVSGAQLLVDGGAFVNLQ